MKQLTDFNPTYNDLEDAQRALKEYKGKNMCILHFDGGTLTLKQDILKSVWISDADGRVEAVLATPKDLEKYLFGKTTSWEEDNMYSYRKLSKVKRINWFGVFAALCGGGVVYMMFGAPIAVYIAAVFLGSMVLRKLNV